MSFHNQIERPVANLRRDNGQDLPALVDQVAGLVKDVQDVWRM
jgi:hypothetical protein